MILITGCTLSYVCYYGVYFISHIYVLSIKSGPGPGTQQDLEMHIQPNKESSPIHTSTTNVSNTDGTNRHRLSPY